MSMFCVSARKKHGLLKNFLVVTFLLLLLTSVSSVGAQQKSEGQPQEKSENAPTPAPTTTTTQAPPKQPQGVANPNNNGGSGESLTSVVYITAIAVSCVIGLLGFTAAGICWYRQTSLMTATERVLYRSADSSVLIHNGHGHGPGGQEAIDGRAHTLTGLAKRTDYPAYGVTGPNPLHNQSYEPPIDKNLSRNAEVYHYNQTKKKIKAMSSSATSESSNSSKVNDPQDVSAEYEVNDEETSDGEYTVYECSGFASAVDAPMEVHNPLFEDMSSKTNGNGGFSYPGSGPNYQTNSVYTSSRRLSNK